MSAESTQEIDSIIQDIESNPGKYRKMRPSTERRIRKVATQRKNELQ